MAGGLVLHPLLHLVVARELDRRGDRAGHQGHRNDDRRGGCKQSAAPRGEFHVSELRGAVAGRVAPEVQLLVLVEVEAGARHFDGRRIPVEGGAARAAHVTAAAMLHDRSQTARASLGVVLPRKRSCCAI
eukprot:4542002-Prymnesium_polylepis.1